MPDLLPNGRTVNVSTSKSTSVDSLYAGYEMWKGWEKAFSYGSQDAEYFTGEMRDVQIQGAQLLEIGFGGGKFLAWARDRGATVAGTEINGASLTAAEALGIETLGPAIEDIAHLHAARFDTIISLDAFEHFSIEDVSRRLRACETMLKPGGSLVLRFPNAQSPFGLAPQHGDPTHKSALSRSIFEQLSQGTSLTIERYAPSYRIGGGGLCSGFVRLVRGLLRDLISVLLNFIYAQAIPWDPVVVLVLKKRAG